MSNSSAVKISAELAESARQESAISARSMTQQIEYWARIGRALERSPSVSMSRVQAALKARLDYDALNADERAVVLGRVEAHVFDPQGSSSLHREFRKAGRSYSAVDEDGAMVKVLPSGERVPSKPARRFARQRHR
jgi:hypothetical protein